MGVFMHDDICEQILVRLDVKDLFRYKSVCKSWKSLISHPRFANAHHRRQVNLNIPYPMAIIPYNYLSKYGLEYFMVGSSNGLACITSFDGNEIIVANPWTREERMLQNPGVCSQSGSCWGFGYDALTDDYKVVFGAKGLEKTFFHVLSLKSNVWKHVGHVNSTQWATTSLQIGTLCNGALHWPMYDEPLTEEMITVSFDLSKEIIQPDDVIRECSFLAILDFELKKYNVKVHWKKMGCDSKLRIEPIHTYTFIPTTVMPSLISPHLQEGSE